MDSDFDDTLDDLLADITENGKKKSSASPSKAQPTKSEPNALQKAKNAEFLTEDIRADTTKKNSRSFVDDMSGRTQEAKTTTKDPFSDIFEKGAWRQAVQQQSLSKQSRDASKCHLESDGDVTKKEEKTHSVRFSDMPEFEPKSTKANLASKLEHWLQQDSTDVELETGSTKTPRTAPSRDIVGKTSPEKAPPTDNPVTSRQRGVIDLSFLGSTSVDPDRKAAGDTSKPQHNRGTDWLSDKQKNETETASTAKRASSTRPNTAPDSSLSGTLSQRSRRTRGLDWLGVSEEVEHETSAKQGGESSALLERRPKASGSLDDLDFGGENGEKTLGECETKGTKKALPWLPKKPEKLETANQVDTDKQRESVTRSQRETQVSEADGNRNRGVKQDFARMEEMENIIAQLRGEVCSLNSKLQVAEQEKELFRRQIDKLKEMHQTELQTCEEMYKRLQTTTESRLVEQHEKTVAHYEAQMRKMEQKAADLDLERTRLEGEIGQRTERLRQQCKEEVNALQEMHKMAVSKLKAQHEEEMQRVRWIRNQEVEAVCSTLDQSRNLQDITTQMSQQQSEIKLLQSKLEETVDSGLNYRQNALDSKERQLQALEVRLRKEHDEMREELRQARNLMAYLQQLNSQQTQQVEEEKWKLSQEVAQLRAYKKAQEEKANLLEDQMQRQRAALELMKNNLLREQHNLVSQVASSLKDTTREREDQVRAAQLENRQREIDATALQLNIKRRDVENTSMAANQLWEKCKKRERFLATWEAQLYARESALLKASGNLLTIKGTVPERRRLQYCT
ncbi:fas-binding factor 1 homolog [Ornithodoros turicata]|uniref:fas-binding factor 1 homolog n=1 Tax=Ornithodoros turicata TaxID=34597 RepID=UPI0031393090